MADLCKILNNFKNSGTVIKMATGGDPGQLTRRQIALLASAIATDKMESIAEGYMNIRPETVKNIWQENQGKAEAFNRAVIICWANQNPKNQVQVCWFHFNS